MSSLSVLSNLTCNIAAIHAALYLLLGSNFHNNSLERVLETMPVIPINPFAVRSVCATEVQPIQV